MLFSGVLILVGAVAMTKFQRVYEAAVFKTLGASTRLIGEHAAARVRRARPARRRRRLARRRAALTWGVSRFALDIPWRGCAGADTSPASSLTTALVAAIGVVSSLDVLRRKPLATLRAE